MGNPVSLVDGQELDDKFSGLADSQGLFTVAGFGSLLSERSARSTFPDLSNFRVAKVLGWRRVFAQRADIFYLRNIARPHTGEVSSLSLEPFPSGSAVVSLFELAHSAEVVQAFINREHEFRFCAVKPVSLAGEGTGRDAVICSVWNDEEYRARRCGPEEWARRWGVHGIERVWDDPTILPCRVYLRHCVLAAQKLCPEAYESFLDETYLADRTTCVRQWLDQNPEIMDEEPPPELVGRYSG